MNRAELREVHFDLPPGQPGGRKNRVSYIEVLRPDGSTRILTFAEPAKYIRTIRDEHFVIQNDEAPKISSWIDSIRGLKNHGSRQSGKEVLARSQVSCFDTRTGLLKSRKLDIYPVAPNQLSITEKEEFNASGHPHRYSIIYGSKGKLKYSRNISFDWETGNLVKDEEYSPHGLDCWIIKNFDPETGVAQEQRWMKIGEGENLDLNSGRIMVRQNPSQR